MAKRRCKGTTKKGKRCKAPPLTGGDYCLAHSDEETRELAGFGGPQEGAGRPALPAPHERMRERIEQEIEAIIAPYFEAITDAVLHTTHEGEVVLSEHPDLGARMAAAERLLDRVYGKPRHALGVVVSSPIRVNADAFADPETRAALKAVVERVAAARDDS